MQRIISCIWFLSVSSCMVMAQPGRTEGNSEAEWTDMFDRQIHMADPTIVLVDGVYYLSGTDDAGGSDGFKLYSSVNLSDWNYIGLVLKKGEHVFGNRGFWAPQFVKTDDGWLIFYTADEQVAVAAANAVTSPFSQQDVQPLDNSEHNIDPFLFRDDDGNYYLYHVRFDNGNYLWACEFDMDSLKVKPQTLSRCFTVSQPWEKTNAYESVPVMEGPTVVKYRGKYILFYSCNHFMSPDYAVGVAYADSPLGPWRKYEGNPIISTANTNENGPGHGDVFQGKDGELYYVFHTHFSDKRPVPRRTRIVPLTIDTGIDGHLKVTADTSNMLIPRIAMDEKSR